MQKETKTVCYDRALELEAYRFEGITRPFPNHFHDFYVIGAVELGERVLSCNNREYRIGRGDLLLFNPNDSHGCTQAGGEALCYRALNLSRERMSALAEKAGRKGPPLFRENVIADRALCEAFLALHRMIPDGALESDRQEALLSFLVRLAERYGSDPPKRVFGSGWEVERVCALIERHFDEPISLERLCRCANLSKSALLRAFTREKGVTPYRYLQAVRIERAKKMLEAGVSPLEAAMRTGFSDQSHFSRFFRCFIGLSPARYARIFGNEPYNGREDVEK